MSTKPLVTTLIGQLARAQLRLAELALIVMMLVTVADVAMRYLFNHPITGSYDLVESTLVVFVFHGLSSVFLSRQNIQIDLIDSLVGRSAVIALTKMSDLLSVAALGLLTWAMITPALQAWAYGDRKLELNLPIYMLWIFALAGIVGAILCALALLFGRVLQSSTGTPE